MADWKAADTLPAFQSLPTPSPDVPASPYAPPAADTASNVNWSGYEPSGLQVRPWVRYWARTFDYLLFCMLFGGVASLAIPEIAEADDTLLGIVLLFAYNFVEPALLTSMGTTPFKALFCIRVRNQDGSKLSYLQGLRRIFSVWTYGQGLGIPFVSLITCITSYNRLNRDRITLWDQKGGLVVTHQPVSWWRWLLLVGLAVGFIQLIRLGSEM